MIKSIENNQILIFNFLYSSLIIVNYIKDCSIIEIDCVWETGGGGGILSYIQDILGGFCPCQQKRVGGGFCPGGGGDFVRIPLEPPKRGVSNVYPQTLFRAKSKKNIKIDQLKIVIYQGLNLTVH